MTIGDPPRSSLAPAAGPRIEDGGATPGQSVPPKDQPRYRTWAVVAFLLIGACLGAYAWHVTGAPPTTERPRLSIALLPFENLSGDAAEDYLADGISDDLTSDLAHIPGAFVIARQSAYTYRGKATDVRRIGGELGVRYVLEGSVRRIGGVLRVNAQLISGETGAHLWSDRFDEPIADLADGQDQILARLRGKLGISLFDIEAARSLRERPANPDAFDLILRARSLWNQGHGARRRERRACWLSALWCWTHPQLSL